MNTPNLIPVPTLTEALAADAEKLVECFTVLGPYVGDLSIRLYVRHTPRQLADLGWLRPTTMLGRFVEGYEAAGPIAEALKGRAA